MVRLVKILFKNNRMNVTYAKVMQINCKAKAKTVTNRRSVESISLLDAV